ncbi:hypothetical protein FXV83_35540 [Bradyrhizobium hipponense]|uniref:Uncharacterized protein n=1 Tax=Bradyrhizobium hipponense TaxID=2605638 RepID=A0A5S4YE17_9BRAD|nr:hypothetical protein FXV83_35540 [Bradyrhizobium hipponense]
MRDTTGGITANFVHTPARRNKFSVRATQNLNCADNPVDRLPTAVRKPLRLDDLSGHAGPSRDMLMDVNKRA